VVLVVVVAAALDGTRELLLVGRNVHLLYTD
jgi:hypothetical protein